MKLRDIKIGTQLRLGFGVLAILIIAIAGLAWIQTDQIWLQLKGLYNHPLTVRRAIGALEADTLQVQIAMMELPLARDAGEVDAIAARVDVLEADADGRMVTIATAYLGPKEDVAGIAKARAVSTSIRAETFRLMRAGSTAEVIARVQPGGKGGASRQALLDGILKVDRFALARGDLFFSEAQGLHSSLRLQLVMAVGIAIGLALLVSWAVMQGILPPLQQLTTATSRFGEGNMDARSEWVSANEIGTLAASFNAMGDAIRESTERSGRSAQVVEAMLTEDESHGFFNTLLQSLMEQTGSQVGAVYLATDDGSTFEHFESIGLEKGARESFSAAGREGELGAAVATRRIQHIADVPADTRFTFAGVSGDFTPRDILTIPIPSDHTVGAVISLASLRAYDASTLRMVDDVWGALIARVNGALAVRGIQRLSEDLEHQNRELDAQKRELGAQASELTEQNTELEMQKRQLDESNRLKSAFLSNMSHELRTPLNSVIALSGVLGRRLAGTVPAEEYGYLEVIERNGKNLLALINDILDLSRIEAGKEELSIGRFSLHEMASEIFEMVSPQAEENGVSLQNLVGSDLTPVVSDPAKVRHILQNIIANAVKFTAQGEVSVSATREGDDVLVAVTDTGIGIAADQLPHIFDEFRQADDSTSRKYGGTGLGLAIANEYAHLLSGDITVESTPGKGSVFTLRLPVELDMPFSETDEDGLRCPRAPLRGVASEGHGECILLVEDSEPAIIQMTDVLTTHGYHVLVARNGREALDQIAQQVPDAMILDLMMPEVDGFEVLGSIRREEETSHLPVLILTAKHVTKDELSFLKGNGIRQLIQKGDIDVEGLIGAVAKMVTAEPTPAPVREPRTPRPKRSGKPVALVVEDNPDNRRTARALLEGRYEVIEAENGQVGVELARLHKPDVILMDVVMPVMDGVQALAELRREDATRDIPVIVVTASAMRGDRETMMGHGFDGYVSKPIDEELLRAALRETLG